MKNVPPIDIIRAIRDPRIFGPLFKDLKTWANWIIALKAMFGLPMDAGELDIYRRFTGRASAPTSPFKEIFLVIGRRAGKSFISALVAVYLAVFVRWNLGIERGFVMVIATDRRQAGVVFSYIRSILSLPAFRGMVESETTEEIRLTNNIVISVQTCSYRSLRGYQICAVVCDEIGLWRTESSANPAGEILTAIRPSLGALPGSMLIGASTGFERAGPLWEVYRDKFGEEDPETLVWAGPTIGMNPTYRQAVIDRALKDDYTAASVEFGVDGQYFRADLEGYLSIEALEAVIVPGRLELAPQKRTTYVAGVDSSGGRGDAMVLAIAHREGERVVQDVIRAWYPPFNPQACVKDFAGVVKEYGARSVVGDKYAASWCSSEFEGNGLTYKNAEMTKSDYYLEFLPLVMRGGVELLDHRKQAAEFRQLLRRTGKGKDSVDHPPGGHDDHANAAALALVEAGRKTTGRACVVGGDVYPREGSGSGAMSVSEWFAMPRIGGKK